MRLTWLRLCTAFLLLAMSAFAQTTSTTTTVTTTTGPQPSSSNPAPSAAAYDQDGKPITDTLIYTIDPVTGKRIPVYLTTTPPQATTPPEPPPTKSERKAALAARHSFFDDRYHVGIMASIGAAGAGVQIGIPLVPHIALRVGADYARYNGTYQYDVANLNASVHAGYGRVALDYFPWRNGRFHISPMFIVGNQTHVVANVALPSSTTFDLGGQSFYGTAADPLHGMGRVDLKKTAPGLTVGFGNLTHGRGHWTFPFELGAFYNDTPKLQVNFTGTACVANQPRQFACQRVQDNIEFQTSLKAFRTRQEHNLTYARFMPIVNTGIGLRF
ncbi:hypothetical protein [Terriglobus sp.]|uniref:hypothetical protein n=1 Tax=Terriglobus sp. TaxID=1889013 RepID=UPI003B009675